MEWNLKTASWDITDLEQETIPNIGAFGGSSSFGDQGINGDFSVDLKLGQVVESGVHMKVQTVSKMALSPLGSSKRTRAINNGNRTAFCLVDGCNTDLSNCREYHRRHKVCELHSKASQVTINGHKQRFCQQCSRFQSLNEFDEGKRSCRKRLDGHNRRRRKRQPEPLSQVGSFFSSSQDTTLLPFSSSQVYPITEVANWDGIVKAKAEEDSKLYNQFSHSHLPDKHNPYPESSSCSDKGAGKQFSFLHSSNLELSNQTAQDAYACQPLLKTFASSESGGGNNKMFRDEFSTRVIHSDCALSLLSSSPTKSGIGLSYAMQPNSISVAHYNSMESMESILVPNAGDAEVQCQGMFCMVPHAFRDNEPPQTLPFYWE